MQVIDVLPYAMAEFFGILWAQKRQNVCPEQSSEAVFKGSRSIS